MASDDGDAWTWKFAPRAVDQFDDLEHHVQDRIATKLDEIVDDSWRDTDDYLEPLAGGPFEKLRVGQYRLACVVDHGNAVLEVHRIEHRSGAYTADD